MGVSLPTTMGFPTKNDHFGVFWGYHHVRKHPCIEWVERAPHRIHFLFMDHFGEICQVAGGGGTISTNPLLHGENRAGNPID